MPEDILKKILATKKEEVAEKKRKKVLSSLKALGESIQIRPFSAVIQARLMQGVPAVIAEIKKASPSQGVIREQFNVIEHAKDYADNGACCLSVLTDVEYFQGHESYILQAKTASRLPVLRKDFIIDSYQIQESRYIGADCVLLIAAALSPDQLLEYTDLAQSLGMDVLVEVHDESEMEVALHTKNTLIGINHRNLRTFEVDLTLTERLLKDLFEEERLFVGESGIKTPEDVAYLIQQGVGTFLIGESFMRAKQPGEALKALFPDNPSTESSEQEFEE